ncbi:MerR family transcriptional regulator [Micromonospora echinaurantiaca]|uniref:helix-turn-helix domain-containing protein n=1 Tax=Micromonospora TaxID=1873 RepID=UPI000D6FC52B|nr:MerR family transcriptional regulator [Micromonospora sp. S4605]PWU45221.1 MerR family transcriptional regulator [Micromonospora sp. S4605]
MKSTSDQPNLSIGEIAARFGLPTHVLRHWESVGLLTPARAVAGRRRYGTADLYRIATILRAKEAGFSLDDVRAVLDEPDPAERRRILARQRSALAERIARAQASLEIIDVALRCEHEDLARCPHYRASLAARIGGR